MKTWGKVAAVVLALAVLLMILLPRLWVKNSRARLVYGGKVSEKVRLYHGAGGRMMVRLDEPGEDSDHVFLPGLGMWTCPPASFRGPKLVVFTRDTDGCSRAQAHSLPLHESGEYLLRYTSPRRVMVEVRWLPANR